MSDTPIAVVLRNLADKLALLGQLRKCDTFGEMMVATALWRSRDGWNVVTQGRFDGYRVDIVIPEARLCIEVDGEAGHGTEEQRAYDRQRQSEIEARGWTFLRPTATDAFLHAGAVASVVIDMARDALSRPLPVSEAEALAAAIARTSKAIDNFEAHLRLVDPDDLDNRTDNEARLRVLRLQLASQLERQAMLGKDMTWEEQEAVLRRVQEAAKERQALLGRRAA